jgi:hypothetical protein
MTMITNTYKGMILTLALRHSSNLKVQTALLNENLQLARDLLIGYCENDVAEAQYLHDANVTALAPHERAARLLTHMHGPRLKREIREVVNSILPD